MSYFRELLKNLDVLLLLLPFLLGVISVVMIGSTAYDGNFSFTGDMKVQIVAFGLGLGAVVVFLLIDYQILERIDKILYAAAILLLLAVYIPGLGSSQYGTLGWIDLGPVNLQPSEVVKAAFILVYASYLSRREEDLQSLRGLLLAGCYALPFIGLVVLQGDLGNALVYCVVTIVMIYYAGVKTRLYAKVALVGVLCIPLMYYLMDDYQKERIDAFLHPEDLSLEGNYQVWNSKVAIGSGGVTGKGLFEGTQKELDFLPVQESDFIFSVIVEELGLIGGLTVLLLYVLLLWRIAKIAGNAKDMPGALIAVGALAMFFFQIFENIGMTMGVMPVTGITLPFISYGGSSVVTNMAVVGLVLTVGIRSKVINF
ncbi:MAG: rod shape-determining protein RodA [Bacillota bacterium]|nr:rod shape-determining protein RodA [Bacillota bacterium]